MTLNTFEELYQLLDVFTPEDRTKCKLTLYDNDGEFYRIAIGLYSNDDQDDTEELPEGHLYLTMTYLNECCEPGA